MSDESGQFTIDRSRDPKVIEDILVNRYFDGPVCFFPLRLMDAAAHWLAASESVFFVVAESDGQHAGFVFSHTLGPALWRSFIGKHPYLFPYAACALIRRRLTWLRSRSYAHLAHLRPQAAPERVTELDIPKTQRPFAWSPPDASTAYVDLLSVAKPFRGRNLACSMLRKMSDDCQRRGIRRLEAHIDIHNYASVRAFRKAGWDVVETSTNDYLAYCDLDNNAK
jgi:ribosomal protein S18 acetylase RimI-like enzyme